MSRLYVCNRAGAFETCKYCEHSGPHERHMLGDWKDDSGWCSQWRACWDGTGENRRLTSIMVRCVRARRRA
jgi:hypothetical protein